MAGHGLSAKDWRRLISVLLVVLATIGALRWRTALAQEAVGAHLSRAPAPVAVSPARRDALLDRLVAAYPDFLASHAGNDLIWKDGTRTPVFDGKTVKSPAQIIADPDILDLFAWRYPLSDAPATAPTNDPGRARPAAFFRKMYGDCHAGQVAPHLVKVRWLDGKILPATSVNGVAAALQAAADDLKRLGPSYSRYLSPSAGTYSCRPIAGTSLASMHAYGAAIDIAVASSDYWLWSGKGSGPYRNRVPLEIVRVFERHGFIWGGRWADFDTMHFEYRPEIIAAARMGSGPG